MRNIFLLIFIILISGCSNKKIDELLKGSSKYKEIEKSKSILLQSAIVIVTENKNSYTIEISPRDNKEIFLQECKSGKNIIDISLENNTWLKRYKIFPTSKKIECQLSTKEKFTI